MFEIGLGRSKSRYRHLSMGTQLRRGVISAVLCCCVLFCDAPCPLSPAAPLLLATLSPHQEPLSETAVVKRELVRLWSSLTEGSHRWEIQAAFVRMVTEIALRLIHDRNEADPGDSQVRL